MKATIKQPLVTLRDHMRHRKMQKRTCSSCLYISKDTWTLTHLNNSCAPTYFSEYSRFHNHAYGVSQYLLVSFWDKHLCFCSMYSWTHAGIVSNEHELKIARTIWHAVASGFLGQSTKWVIFKNQTDCLSFFSIFVHRCTEMPSVHHAASN